MMHALKIVEQHVGCLSRGAILALATSGLMAVGGLDYLTGYEVSLSVLYLGPVAIAAWYAGRASGVIMAALSCLSWYIADIATGHPYSHPMIPVWNAFVRLGFFVITAWLLTALRTSHRALQDLARTDALTGLYGRREFDSRLKHDLALVQRHKGALTFAYVDVDNFKAVNDTHGHGGGDRVLRAVAAALKESVRETDTGARLGGDEFALILPDIDSGMAKQVFSRLELKFRETPVLSNWGVTCSIGVVTFLDSATSPEQVIATADQLMYQVKRSGKGAVAFSVLGDVVQPGAAADAPEAAHL